MEKPMRSVKGLWEIPYRIVGPFLFLLLLPTLPFVSEALGQKSRNIYEVHPVHIERNQDVEKLLAAGDAYVEKGALVDGARIFHRLLDRPDCMNLLVAAGPGLWLPLDRACAQRLLAAGEAMSRICRGLYGARAEALLGSACRDPVLLRRVADRYPLSVSAPRALAMAGNVLFERGDFAKASRAWALLSSRYEAFTAAQGKPLALRMARAAAFDPSAVLPAEPRPNGPCWAHIHAYRDATARFPTGTVCADSARIYAQDMSRLMALDRYNGKLVWMRTFLSPPNAADPGSRRILRIPRPVVTPVMGPHPVPVLAGDRLFIVLDGRTLMALSPLTGKTLFTLSWVDLRKAFSLDLPGRIAPRLLVVGQTVYLVYVTDGFLSRVCCMALGASDGRPLWARTVFSRQSAGPGGPILVSGQGTLFLLSNQGCLAALDRGTGKILWVRAYAASHLQGWEESRIFVRSGRFAAAPADSEVLLCGEIETGRLHWRAARRQAEQLLLHKDGPLMAVGRDRVELLGWDGRVRSLPSQGRVRSLPSQGRTGSFAASTKALYFPGKSGIYRVDQDSIVSGHIHSGFIRLPEVDLPSRLLILDDGVVSVSSYGILRHGEDLLKKDLLPQEIPADEHIVPGLGSQDWSTRRLAHSLLRQRGPAAVKALQAGLHDPDPEVVWRCRTLLHEAQRPARLARWKAALGKKILTRLAKTVIPDLLAANPARRWRGVLALAKEEEDVTVLLKDFIGEPHLPIRLAAAASLYRRGGEEALPVLKGALASPDAEVRATALGALGSGGNIRLLPFLKKGLLDKVAKVRLAALRGLGALDEPLDSAFLRRLFRDPDSDLRAEAVSLFGKKCGPELRGEIARLVREDPSRAVRLRAVEALEVGEDEEAARGLSWALADADAAIRAAAAHALFIVVQGESGAAVPLAALARGLAISEDEVRLTVVQIVRLHPAPAARDLLLAVVADRVPQIARLALESLLGRLTAADLGALAPLARHKDEDLRFYFLQLLEKMKGPYASILMAVFLADSVPAIRQAAAESLVSSPSDQGIGAAVALAATAPDDALRELCDRVLSSLSVEARTGGCIFSLKHAEAKARARAAEELRKMHIQRFNFRAQDPSVLRNEAADSWIRWWWERCHPKDNLKTHLANLLSQNPAWRWEAARATRGMPLRRAVEDLVEAMCRETVPWVRSAQILSLRAVAGRSFGWKDGMDAKTEKAIIAKWKAWWEAHKSGF